MSMSTFKILFYLRKNYLNKNKQAGIMVRITLNGEITQFSSKLEADPNLWDTKAGKMSGNSLKARQLNTLLESIRFSITNHYREIERIEGYVTVEKVRNAYLGITTRQQTLLELYKKHNEDVQKLIGKSIAKATYEKHDRTCRRLEDFMQKQYHVRDIALKEINHSFITNFEAYLRSDCNCSENTTAKFIQFFRRIIIIAKNNGWIQIDPFANYSIRLKRVDRGYLTKEELTKIMQKEFSTKRLEQVRDIFIFSCFTGLAYIDVKNLTENNIITSDGKQWICTHRQKTDTAVNVPLLKIPAAIIEKYKDVRYKSQLLPVLSNQKLNSYLKEIGDLCGIHKNITFHLARHTFATTTTLANGVPIETVSKMLGHTNITTTQIYARITNDKINRDMQKLSDRLQDIEQAANF